VLKSLVVTFNPFIFVLTILKQTKMKITLNYPPSKDLPNGYTIISNERELRPYQSVTDQEIKKFLAKCKKLHNKDCTYAEAVIQICELEKELMLRKHPDYEQYHKDWLVVFKEREQEWEKECQEREKWIDIEIAKLQEKRAELRNPK